MAARPGRGIACARRGMRARVSSHFQPGHWTLLPLVLVGTGIHDTAVLVYSCIYFFLKNARSTSTYRTVDCILHGGSMKDECYRIKAHLAQAAARGSPALCAAPADPPSRRAWSLRRSSPRGAGKRRWAGSGGTYWCSGAAWSSCQLHFRGVR